MSLHPKIFLRVPPTSIQNFMLVSLIAQFFHLRRDDRGGEEDSLSYNKSTQQLHLKGTSIEYAVLIRACRKLLVLHC